MPRTRRSLGAFLIALMVAVMVGIREATGTAPPPPVFVTERVEWLSPELEREGPDVVLTEGTEFTAPAPPPAEQSHGGLIAKALGLLGKLSRGS